MNTLPLRGSDGVLANGGVVSPGTRSRQSSTRFTPMLSSVHPVSAIDPASTVASPAGVSKTPNGGDTAAVLDTVVSVTLIGDAAFADPVKVSVIAPVCDEVRPAANCVEIVRAADPLPELGETTSHGLVDTAVHVTVLGPEP